MIEFSLSPKVPGNSTPSQHRLSAPLLLLNIIISQLAEIVLFLAKKISTWIFHQMLVCQKYGGVAEIRTRASLATPNDLAKDELCFTAIFNVTFQPNLTYFKLNSF